MQFMRDIKTNKFGAMVADKVTQSLLNFTNEIGQTEFLMFFIMIGDKYISENKEEARQTLIEIYEDPANEVSLKSVEIFKTEKADELFDMMFYVRWIGFAGQLSKSGFMIMIGVH